VVAQHIPIIKTNWCIPLRYHQFLCLYNATIYNTSNGVQTSAPTSGIQEYLALLAA